MFRHRFAVAFLSLMVFLDWSSTAQVVSPNVLGAPQVAVTHSAGKWTLRGRKNTVVLNESDLAVSGGPTFMGPTWRAQLGRFGYLRSIRMVFFPKGNYVDLCKRYRRYVMDSGLFVSLRDKMAHKPVVQNLIGSPVLRIHLLRNVKPGSAEYDPNDPQKNYRVTTFAQAIQLLREVKAQGFSHVSVSLSGWLKEGYDRQTPDALPPAQAAGGWAGMKAFFDACHELGDTCWLHDHYRDYYLDAPSWNPDFAVHEQDSVRPPAAFPGTRFKNDWKDGYIPLMDHWDGGTQGYLNSRFMLRHLVKNYRLMFEHGIHPDGSYQDVSGYIPPDQDFNPEHPHRLHELQGRCLSLSQKQSRNRWHRRRIGLGDSLCRLCDVTDESCSCQRRGSCLSRRHSSAAL